jgi:GAF domain-containing protein
LKRPLLSEPVGGTGRFSPVVPKNFVGGHFQVSGGPALIVVDDTTEDLATLDGTITRNGSRFHRKAASFAGCLNDPARLDELERTGLIDAQTEEPFDRLTNLARKILEAPVSLVSLVQTDRQFFKSQQGLPEPWATIRETPISHSFCQHVVISGEPLVVDDATHHPLVCNNPAIEDLNVVSYLGIPLKSPDGWHLGSFCVIDHQPRSWTQQDVDIMQDLAESVMTEIKLRFEMQAKADALTKLQERNAELDAFAHTVSHNLKTPLSGIIGWTSLSTQYSDKMDQQELLDSMRRIDDLAAHANDIISALLLLAGVSQSEQIPTSRLNMFNILDDALSRLAKQISDNDVRIRLPNTTEFPRCIGHRKWVEEVWINLISNAIKYGGSPPIIEFGASQESSGFVRYWLKDTGFLRRPCKIWCMRALDSPYISAKLGIL